MNCGDYHFIMSPTYSCCYLILQKSHTLPLHENVHNNSRYSIAVRGGVEHSLLKHVAEVVNRASVPFPMQLVVHS